MKSTPILFKPELVRKILSGEKTQTRRTVKQVLCEGEGGPGRARLLRFENGIATFGDSIPDDPCPIEVKCPWGGPGEVVWVRETWRPIARGTTEAYDPREGLLLDIQGNSNCEYGVQYRADGAVRWHSKTRVLTPNTSHHLHIRGATEKDQWKPSIHMPRWACRLELPLCDVRCERLQDIAEADALAEGTHLARIQDARDPTRGPLIDGFANAWDRINGERASWVSNPWVWVLVWKADEIRRLGGTK